MTKLPVPAGPETARRLASMDEKIARLRAATGKPETRIVACMCSVQNRSFLIHYARTDPRALFTIARLEKLEPSGETAAAPSGSSRPIGPAAEANTLKVADFDNTGYACPWCASSAGHVYHDQCHTNYCGAARRQGASGENFTCPACRETLYLAAATEIHATGGSAAAKPGEKTPLLGQGKPSLRLGWRRS